MADTPQDHLLDWLRDAHAMEEQAITMLEAQASRLENYPALRRRVQEHLHQTRAQAALVRGLHRALRQFDLLRPQGHGGKFMATLQAWADRWPRTR